MRSNFFRQQTILGAAQSAANLCFSRDGETLLAASGTRLLATNMKTRATQMIPTAVTLPITHVGVDAANAVIGVASGTTPINFISFATHVTLAHLKPRDEVSALEFHPTLPLLAVGYARMVEVYRLPDLASATTYTPTLLYRNPVLNDRITMLRWHKRRLFLYSAENDKVIVNSKGVPVASLGQWSAKIANATVRDGKLVVVSWKGAVGVYCWGGAGKLALEARHVVQLDGKIVDVAFGGGVMAVQTTEELGVFEAEGFTKIHSCALTGRRIAVSPRGTFVAISDVKKNKLLVYEWKTESFVVRTNGHAAAISAVAMAWNGEMAASGDVQGEVRVWRTSTAECAGEFKTRGDGDAGSDVHVTGVAFMRNNLGVVVSLRNGLLKAFDLIKKKCFRVIPVGTRLDGVLVESKDGLVVTWEAEAARAYIVELRTSKVLDTVAGHEGPISCVALHPTTSELLTGSWDKTVRITNFLQDMQTELLTHPAEVTCVDVNETGNLIVTGCRDGNLYVWDSSEKTIVGLIAYRLDMLGGVIIGKDSTKNAVDKTTSLYPNAPTHKKQKFVSSVRFLADNNELVVCGGNAKKVLVYNITSRVLVSKADVSTDRTYANAINILYRKEVLDPVDPNKTINVKDLAPSPAGKYLSVLTEEGLLLMTSESSVFRPFSLTEAITPEAVHRACARGAHTTALAYALHLADEHLTQTVFRSIPQAELTNVAAHLPNDLVAPALEFLAKEVEGLLFHRAAVFTMALLKTHTTCMLKQNVSMTQTPVPSLAMYTPQLRQLYKAISTAYRNVSAQTQQALALLEVCQRGPLLFGPEDNAEMSD